MREFCTEKEMEDPQKMRCKVTEGEVGMRFFYPDCKKYNPLCKANCGAWVPSITVCNQQLFT